MENTVEWKHELYRLLSYGELDRAEELILKIMDVNIDDLELDGFLKTIKFWQNRKEFFNFSENNGEVLLEEWEKFVNFCKNNKIDNSKLLSSLKSFIYSKAIGFLVDAYKISPIKDKEKLIKLGKAFYEVGLLDKAIETFEFLFSMDRERDLRIYLWLANLYYEVGEKDLSSVMYNDVFFYFSPMVEVNDIKDTKIKKCYDTVKEDFLGDNEEVIEWLPVYCYLYDVLTVKRKLEYVDFVELRKKIMDYEASLKNSDKKIVKVIVPRLINCYIWLIDYYLYQASAIEPVKSVLKRMMELFDTIENEMIKNKLKERSFFVFNNLIEKRQQLQNSEV